MGAAPHFPDNEAEECMKFQGMSLDPIFHQVTVNKRVLKQVP